MSLARRTKHCLTALAVVGLTLATVGCTRKAPGPLECEALALRMIGVRDVREAELRGVKPAVDRLTVECLTLPYDAEMLACVRVGRDVRVCSLEMKVRADARRPGD
ncbi:MAG: hypothetical protein KF718_04045 [Polyangiaceae bacterium]|nr:hypothetical protein [Polyangiaceae bacterium]